MKDKEQNIDDITGTTIILKEKVEAEPVLFKENQGKDINLIIEDEKYIRYERFKNLIISRIKELRKKTKHNICSDDSIYECHECYEMFVAQRQIEELIRLGNIKEEDLNAVC